MPDDAIVSVRYLVDDVAAAVDFYRDHFGFTVNLSALPRLRTCRVATSGCCCRDR